MQQTLPPITSPLSSLAKLGIAIPLSKIAPALFAIVVLFWLIYTLVAAYHWFRYSHASWVALPAVAVHLFVSAIFIMFSASGLIL